MQWAMDDSFFLHKSEELWAAFETAGIPCQKLY
jgi:hypothetical protein